jgi:ribose/xylose/arabinose/galactoside ABC-type transport system permease subunit
MTMDTGSVRGSVMRGKLASFLQQQGALIALVLVIVFATLRYSDRFLNITNLMNIPLQESMIGLLALGMTFVILTGGIDLSVGSLVAVSAVVSAELSGYGLIVALLGGVAVSAILGLISGVVIAKGRIQPFIVTLAMMMAARGLILVFTGENSVRVPAQPSFISIAEGRIQLGALPLYYPVLILIFAYVLGWLVLKYTRFGRHVYSIGDNDEAARLMGLNVGRVTMGVYALSGALAGLAGVILAARQEGAGSPTSAVGWELDAIAAVVIGGTLLTGGQGGTTSTLVGVLLLGVILNALTQENVSWYWQPLFRGLILLAVVIIQRILSRR